MPDATTLTPTPSRPPLDEVRSDLQRMIEAGAPERDIEDYARVSGYTPEEVRARSPGERGSDALRAILDASNAIVNGLTGGYGQEAKAGLHALTGYRGVLDEGGFHAPEPAGDYPTELARENARYEEIPTAIKVPGEVTGGLAQYALARRALGPLAARSFVSQLPRWVQATGLGGLYGGLYGSGEAEPGLENRLGGAARGAAGGAVLGLGTYGLARGGEKLYGMGRDLVQSWFNPRGLARRQVARALARDLPEEVLAQRQPTFRVREDLRTLGPKAMIADVGGRMTPGGEMVGGENVRGLARAAATVPGAAKNVGAYRLAVRAEGEGQRLKKAFGRYLDLNPEDYFADEAALLQKLKDVGEKQYEPVLDAYPVITGRQGLNRMLRESPTIRGLISRAARNAAERRAAGDTRYLGEIDKDLTELARYAREVGLLPRGAVPREGVARDFSLRTWHEVRHYLSEQLNGNERYVNSITGRYTPEGGTLNALLRKLDLELDRATGGAAASPYAAARRAYAGTAESVRALREGRNFLRMAPEEIRQRLGELSESGRAAFRSGAARTFSERVETVADQGSAAQRFFGNEMNRKRLAALDAGDAGAWGDFSGRMRAEQRFGATKAGIGAGSRTIPLGQEQADLERRAGGLGAVFGSEISPFGHPLVAARLGRETAQRFVGRRNPEVNRELARVLFSQNRAHQLQYLDELDQLLAAGARGDRNALALARALAAAGAQQEGRIARPLAAIAGQRAGEMFE